MIAKVGSSLDLIYGYTDSRETYIQDPIYHPTSICNNHGDIDKTAEATRINFPVVLNVPETKKTSCPSRGGLFKKQQTCESQVFDVAQTGTQACQTRCCGGLPEQLKNFVFDFQVEMPFEPLEICVQSVRKLLIYFSQ